MNDEDAVASASTLGAVDRIRVGAAGVVSVVLSLVIVSSAVLSVSYRPQGTFPDPSTAGEPSHLSSWTSIHELALWGALGMLSVWVIFAVASSSHPSRSVVVGRLVAAALAAAGGLVGVFTWPLVRWDQVALWAVTVGSNWSGFWRPAMSDQVRFVFVGGAQVGQGAYLGAVLAHVLSPIIALGAVGARECRTP